MGQEIIKVDDLDINYIHEGGGRDLLILHGWKSSSKAWEEVANLFAQKGFSVYVPDLPGFGRSSVPKDPWGLNDYIQLLLKFSETLKLDKFVLIGHSFGGQVAIKFTARHSDRVEKLILCAPAAIRHKKRLKVQAFYLLAKLGGLVLSLPLLREIREKMRRILYFFAREKDYLTAGNLKETLKRVISEDTTKYLSKINAETLIIWGREDKMTPVSDAYIIEKQLPKASLKILEKANHRFPYEKPKKFVEEVVSFLEV